MLTAGKTITQIFSLDNTTTTQTRIIESANVFHQELFASPPLEYGPHTLTISESNVSALFPALTTLDYFLITRAPGDDLTGQTLFYDDTDPAFTYSGEWSPSDGTDQDMQSTLHGATTTGSTVSFDFNGKASPRRDNILLSIS